MIQGMIDTEFRPDTSERTGDYLPLGPGQQLGVPRFADGPITMGCSHNGSLRVIEAGEAYCTLAFQNPETHSRELIRLCESCFTGRSRKRSERDLNHSRRWAYQTVTPEPEAGI
jgi:hypothetical protein